MKKIIVALGALLGIATAASAACTGAGGFVGPGSFCPGDVNGDCFVMSSEVHTCAQIALGQLPLSAGLHCDANQDGFVTVDELLDAANNYQSGCRRYAQ